MAIPVLRDTADRLTDAIYFGNPFQTGVPSTRAVNTDFGLSGGGTLASNLTLKVNDLVNGYNVLNHGVVADGTTDNTAAYTAIFGLASSGVMVFPPGSYAGSLNLPNGTATTNWSVIGAGIGETILIAASADTPIIKVADRATGLVTGATIGGFSVKAHASGSTGPALDLPGFISCRFQNIGYLSDTGDFNSMFHLSEGQLPCHANTINHVVIDGQVGPGAVVLFDSKDDAGAPGGLNKLSNFDYIEDFFVANNSGIVFGIYALGSRQTTVKNCTWDTNVGCTYVVPGTGGFYYGNYYKGGVTTDTITFTESAGVGASNDNILVKERFADMTALTFPSLVEGNFFLDPQLEVTCTFTNNSAADNVAILAGKMLLGTFQTLHAGSYGTGTTVASTNLGSGGTCTLLTGSNDTDGTISLNFGTSVPSFNGIVTLTFAEAFQVAPVVLISPAAGPASPGTVWTQAASGNPQFQVGIVSTTEVKITWVNGATPADNAVLYINYHVKGIPK